jgi:hypothetical protein
MTLQGLVRKPVKAANKRITEIGKKIGVPMNGRTVLPSLGKTTISM